MNSIGVSRESLSREWCDLQRSWSDVSDKWRDSVRREFSKSYWKEYEDVIPTVIGQLDDLARLIVAARRAMESQRDL